MYMLIALGSLCIPFYFGGLILIGLGQIAINTAPEEERKTYFSSKNGVVSNITPPDGAARTTKSFVSPMLSKIIQNAINIDNDAAILHYLQDSIKRLTKDKEKQIIDYILKVPNGELRPTLLKVYNEITEPVPKPTVSQEPEQ